MVEVEKKDQYLEPNSSKKIKQNGKNGAEVDDFSFWFWGNIE